MVETRTITSSLRKFLLETIKLSMEEAYESDKSSLAIRHAYSHPGFGWSFETWHPKRLFNSFVIAQWAFVKIRITVGRCINDITSYNNYGAVMRSEWTKLEAIVCPFRPLNGKETQVQKIPRKDFYRFSALCRSTCRSYHVNTKRASDSGSPKFRKIERFLSVTTGLQGCQKRICA